VDVAQLGTLENGKESELLVYPNNKLNKSSRNVLVVKSKLSPTYQQRRRSPTLCTIYNPITAGTVMVPDKQKSIERGDDKVSELYLSLEKFFLLNPNPRLSQ